MPPSRYLQIAAHLGISHFEGASNPGRAFTREIDGQLFHFKGERTTAFVDTDSWQLAFFSALTAGMKDGVEVLALVPTSVHHQANLEPDAFDLAFVAMLKGLFDPSATLGPLLVAANEAANADGFTSPSTDASSRAPSATSTVASRRPSFRTRSSGERKPVRTRRKAGSHCLSWPPPRSRALTRGSRSRSSRTTFRSCRNRLPRRPLALRPANPDYYHPS